MSTQYLRKYRLLIMSKNTGEALDLTDLRLKFSIERALTDEAGVSRISVYNPAVSTFFKIQKGDQVLLEAGYEMGDYGLVFTGNVLYTTRRREDGVTTVLELVTRDGDEYLNTAFTMTTIRSGSTVRDVVEAALRSGAQAVGKGFLTDSLNGQGAPRGKTLFGRSADYLRQAGRNAGAQFYIENGAVNIVKAADYAENEAVVLSPETGLIGTPEQEEDAVSGTCLINPRIKLKTKLYIRPEYIRPLEMEDEEGLKTPAPDGVYSVVKIRYEGDTRGDEWYIHFDAIEQSGEKPAALTGTRVAIYR